MKRPIIFALLLVLTLVAGAFAVARSQMAALVQPALAQEADDGVDMVRELAISTNHNGEESSKLIRIRDLKAEGLPEGQAQVRGLFLNRSGQSLSVGTGSVEVEVDVEQFNDEEPVRTISANHSGDDVQVVVNAATTIYADVTEEPDISALPEGESVIDLQHVIEAGDLNELGENMVIRAWGEWVGDQLVATTLVYQPIR